MFKLNKHSWGIINSLKEKIVNSFTNFFGSKITDILDYKESKSKSIYFDNNEYLLENGKLFKIEYWQKKSIELSDSKWKIITNIDDVQLLEWNAVPTITIKSTNWKSYLFNRSFEQLNDSSNANYEYKDSIKDDIISNISFGKFNLLFSENCYYIVDYDSDKNKKHLLVDEFNNQIYVKNVIRQENNIYIVSKNNEIFKFRYGEVWLKKLDKNEFLDFVYSEEQIKQLFWINWELITYQDKKTQEYHKKSDTKKLLLWKWYIKEETNNSRGTNFYLTKSSNLWELDNIEINFPKDSEISPILNLRFKSGARFELTFWNKAEYLLFFNLVKTEFHFEFKNNLDPILKIKELKDSNWKVFKNKFCWVIDINTYKLTNILVFLDNWKTEVNDNTINQKVDNIVGYTYTTRDKLVDKLEKLEIEKELNTQRINQNHQFIITNEKNLLEFFKRYWQFLKPYYWSYFKPEWFVWELQWKKEDFENSIKRLNKISIELTSKNNQLDNEIQIITQNIAELDKKDKYFETRNELAIIRENMLSYKKKIISSIKESDKILRAYKLRELEKDYNLKLLLFNDSMNFDSSNLKYEKEISLLKWKLSLLEQELVNLYNNKVELKWEEIDTYNTLSLTKKQLTNTKLYNWAEYYFELNYKNSSEADFPARLKVHYKHKWASSLIISKDYIVVNYEHSEKVYRWLEKVTKTIIDIHNIKDKLKDIK